MIQKNMIHEKKISETSAESLGVTWTTRTVLQLLDRNSLENPIFTHEEQEQVTCPL